MKKCIVLGGDGFISSHLCDLLLKKIISVNDFYFKKGYKNIPTYFGLRSIYSGKIKSFSLKNYEKNKNCLF